LAAGGLSAQTRRAKPVASVWDFAVTSIDGKDVRLSRYRGKALLIVNVASLCGNTPQYKGLQELYEMHGKRGLVVLGFPANGFRSQEPGSDAEMKRFCTAKYGVTFPMFAKIVVKGEGQAPLYRFLTSKETNPEFGGDIEWNFAKFLVARDGRVAGRFSPKTQPGDRSLDAAIEELLAARP
jgi:glutathione peroxidase